MKSLIQNDPAFLALSYAALLLGVTMTSNNTPTGYVAFADSEAGPINAAWKAFDGNNGTFWSSATTATGTGSFVGDGTSSYIAYQFPTPVVVKAYSILGGAFRFSAGYTLQASKDNVTYVNLHSTNSISSASMVPVNPTGIAYTYYRAVFFVGGNGLAVDTLQFYGH